MMHRLDNDADACWLKHGIDRIGDLGGQFLSGKAHSTPPTKTDR
jgi:hypothetical protein